MPEGQLKTVVYYKLDLDDESSPFEEWLNSVKDKNVRRKVYERIKRMELGHYGSHRNLKGGILELKFDGGLRIYGAEIGPVIVVILCGGGKNTNRDQDKDIARAREYLRSFIGRLKK